MNLNVRLATGSAPVTPHTTCVTPGAQPRTVRPPAAAATRAIAAASSGPRCDASSTQRGA
jgi:hypothetical protein